MNIAIITQARFASTRFPGKILKCIGNNTLLDIHLQRLKKSKLASHFIVATTNELEAESIIEVARRNHCLYFQGDMNDVLDRFYKAAVENQSEVVVRVTSDCPLNDGAEIDKLIENFIASDYDYYSNINPPSFPDGLDIEIFKFSALKKAWVEGSEVKEREHVTPYIRNNPNLFKAGNYSQNEDMSSVRLTVDNPEDFILIKTLVEKLGPNCPWRDYVSYLENNPVLLKINNQFLRNEGY